MTFLASDRAVHVTGQVIGVRGDEVTLFSHAAPIRQLTSGALTAELEQTARNRRVDARHSGHVHDRGPGAVRADAQEELLGDLAGARGVDNADAGHHKKQKKWS